MADIERDRDSLEYLTVDVTADVVVTDVDLAIAPLSARPSSWTAASLSGATASVLVGPGGTVELEPGYYPYTYNVWVRVNDTPEVPVMLAGTLTLT